MSKFKIEKIDFNDGNGEVLTINKKANLTSKEAAEFLDLAEVTLRTYRNRGIEPQFIKRGKFVFYNAKTLIDYKTQKENRKKHGII